ncbi:hypothetical protein [Canibacter oris]|uniref:Uncharacterized protein n=1 Tax=Canibacter oris TaxID=1365628 RepID=A0A840DF50_9MICO|nr:hypothetical protein [Canibacter oris]MBB4072041.1 hypothetical protein [Canibacter oris]
MPEDGFAVGVEYAIGDSRFQPVPTHDRFIMTEDEGDDTDTAKTVTYTGESYVLFQLAHTYHHWAHDAKNNARLWRDPNGEAPVSAGWILDGLIKESKYRGWGEHVQYDFGRHHDSQGAAWAQNEKIKLEVPLLQPLTETLKTLTDGGLCDWTITGTKLRLYRPGTFGGNKTELVLGGANVTRAPVKSDMRHIFTHLTVVPDKAAHWLYLETGQTSKWGRLEATQTQSGVNNHTEATKLAQPILQKGRAAIRQESFEWTPQNPQDLTPFRDFNIGDNITVRSRGARKLRRIIGVTIRDVQGSFTLQAIVGEKVTGVQAKVLQRVAAATVGGHIGGNGQAFAANPGSKDSPPKAPVGLLASINEGRYVDRTAQSFQTFTWAAVTSTVSDSEVTISGYEVWSRLPAEPLQFVTETVSPTASVNVFTPGVQRLVAVRAKTADGRVSAFSEELLFTPAAPTSSTPAAPTGLAVTSNVSQFTGQGVTGKVTLSWTAVTSDTDGAPVAVEAYEVWLDDAPVARVTSPTVVLTVADMLQHRAKVVAISAAGFTGETSDELVFSVVSPAASTIAPAGLEVRAGFGNAVAVWAGNFTAPVAPGFTVQVEVKPAADSSGWVPVGARLSAAASVLIPGYPVGTVLQMRARAFDPLGRTAGMTAVQEITVTGITGDMLNAADIWANSAWVNLLKAGRIEADMLAPSVGETLNLTANQSIMLLAGNQAELAGEVQAVQETAESAAGAALVAKQQAQQVGDSLQKQQAVFVVTPAGAEVRSREGSNVISITPAGAQIMQAGVAVSTWDGSRFISGQVIAGSAQLGEHVHERFGTGRTVIRPL